MKTIEVKTKSPYKVKIGSGLLETCGEELRALGLDGKVLIVSDDNVAGLYFDAVEQSLRDNGFEVFGHIIPHGEESKNIGSLTRLLNLAAENGLSRSDTFIALGGGVVGDLCGFAAAVYMRGINFVQLPTSLLAAVDSSVGGKTAVDLDAGKNLAGAFYQPLLVLCDTDTLSTLPEAEHANGMAEIIKYGFICDRALLGRLISQNADIEEIIACCVAIKARIVANDEFDTGERMLLNFGHTVAHAVELLSGYSIPHGSAVAIGMAAITRGCVKQDSCSAMTLELLLALLEHSGLPDECEFSVDDICAAALKDKKNLHGKITLVLPTEPGKCVLKKCGQSELKELLK